MTVDDIKKNEEEAHEEIEPGVKLVFELRETLKKYQGETGANTLEIIGALDWVKDDVQNMMKSRGVNTQDVKKVENEC